TVCTHRPRSMAPRAQTLARSLGLLAACARGAAGLHASAAAPEDAPEPAPAATYRTRAHEREAAREAAHLAAYDALLGALGRVPSMFHSEHILSYVRDKDYGPSLLHGGCLYLPSNAAWKEFYSYVGHPYPPLFAEMVARSFFAKCDAEASEAQRGAPEGGECADGRIRGPHKCVEVRRVGEVQHQGTTIQLFEADGHVALPSQWKHHIHIDLVSRSDDTLRRAELAERDLPKDKCSKSWQLPAVPEGRKLVVPTQFIVCSSKLSHAGINRPMLLDQARWMNIAYSGRSTYSPMAFDHEDIPEADMQMEFDLFKKNCTPTAFEDCARIIFAHDKECAEQAFVESKFVARHNHDPFGLFTVIFVGDDKSGILGMAEFPQLTGEGQRELVVRVSTTGLRHFSSTNKALNSTRPTTRATLSSTRRGTRWGSTTRSRAAARWTATTWPTRTRRHSRITSARSPRVAARTTRCTISWTTPRTRAWTDSPSSKSGGFGACLRITAPSCSRSPW
ncbi:unnamed protein product, partial [Prorocentrum cordatum]